MHRPRSLCVPRICTARARTAPFPRRAPPTHPYHSPASPRVPVAHPAALTHLPAVPIAPAAHTPPCPLVHPAHRPHLNSLVHPTKVLKLRTFSFLQSISNFMVSLPNLSKRCEGATVPARTTLALRNCHSVSDFIVSLPNVSKKDVKGLLSRKQPLHTSPNRSKKGEAGVSLLSSLRNLTSPPRLCP